MIGRIAKIRPILNYPLQCRTEALAFPGGNLSAVRDVVSWNRDANRRVGYDAHSHHAIGDAIRV